MIAWHYTTERNFLGIARDGLIRPATAFVPRGERPAAWFTTKDQLFEPTACKGHPSTGQTLSVTEMQEHGLFRIGVFTDRLKPWKTFKRRSGISSQMLRALVAQSKSQGSNPDLYWVSFVPVMQDRWSVVEMHYEGAWTHVWSRGDAA